jgi:hypothetical protein
VRASLQTFLLTGFVLLAARALGDAGPPGPRLDVSMRLDKKVFEVGEAIPVTLEVFNRGDDDYSALTSTEPTGVNDGFSFSVFDAESQAVPRPVTLSKPDTWIGSWLTVPPHEKCERTLFLNHWFMPLPPGRYVVFTEYRPRSLAGDWPAVRSRRVEFEIQPTTVTKLDVRISRLAQQTERGDQIAIDFLGFTGEDAAAAPLVTALYSDDIHVQRRAATALCLLNNRAAALSNALAAAKEHGPTAMLAEWLTFADAQVDTVVPLYLHAMNSSEAATRLGGITGLRIAPGDNRFAQPVLLALKRALDDRDARVRFEAVVGLEHHLDEPTLKTLKRMAQNDPESRVRNAAASVMMMRPAAAAAAGTSAGR